MTFEELSRKGYDYLNEQQQICEEKYLLAELNSEQKPERSVATKV